MPMRPPRHQPYKIKTEQQRKKEFDTTRESAPKRGYGRRWQSLAKRVRQEEPLCRCCLALGITKATAEVDHIIPHKGDQTLFWDRGNLQGLCKSCHSRKTATEDSNFARKGGGG